MKANSTVGAAALRDFDPVHVGSGSTAAQPIGTGRQSMSGLPQKRTKMVCAANRRFVPKAVITQHHVDHLTKVAFTRRETMKYVIQIASTAMSKWSLIASLR